MQQNAFDAALGRLSSLLGGGDEPEAAPQTNAMAAARPQKEVAFRASMLPIGNYDDGSVAFPVWPQGAVDAYNAMSRFHRGEAPQPEDAVLAGLVMSGGIGNLASRAARGPKPTGANRMSTPPGHYELYHGTAATEQFDALSLAKMRNRYEPGVFLSDKPEVASNYARTADNLPDGGRVFRAYLPKEEVLDFDLGKLRASDPVLDAIGDASFEKKGAIRFMGRDGENTFMVLSPSTLKYQDDIARSAAAPKQPGSPTLFSNPKEAAPAGALATGSSADSAEHHSRSQPRGEGGRFVGRDSFDGRLAALDKMMIDLDGDGRPDVAIDVPRPTNAMARMAAKMPDANYFKQPSQPKVDVYEALRRERINHPPVYSVVPPAGGWNYPGTSNEVILKQSDADRGIDLSVPSYFPNILP